MEIIVFRRFELWIAILMLLCITLGLFICLQNSEIELLHAKLQSIERNLPGEISLVYGRYAPKEKVGSEGNQQ